jgi:hypothetical protein
MTTPRLLEIISDLRVQLKLGRSINHSLEEILQNKQDPLSKSLKVWLVRTQTGHETQEIIKTLPELKKIPTRLAFLSLLEKGMRGSPLDAVLESFEEELFLRVENVFEKRLQTLPLKLLMPLTLLILPGVMGILLGPLFVFLAGGNL